MSEHAGIFLYRSIRLPVTPFFLSIPFRAFFPPFSSSSRGTKEGRKHILVSCAYHRVPVIISFFRKSGKNTGAIAVSVCADASQGLFRVCHCTRKRREEVGSSPFLMTAMLPSTLAGWLADCSERTSVRGCLDRPRGRTHAPTHTRNSRFSFLMHENWSFRSVRSILAARSLALSGPPSHAL